MTDRGGKKDNAEQMCDNKWGSPVDRGRILRFVAAVFTAL